MKGVIIVGILVLVHHNINFKKDIQEEPNRWSNLCIQNLCYSALVITGLWYNGVVNDQKMMLQQSRERLTLANQDIESGKLKAANSLLIQSEIDLKGINGFFILPFIEKEKEDLLNQHQSFRIDLMSVWL